MGKSEGRIGLAEFLRDLRTELSEAERQASGNSLKLGVEEISLTLEVAYSITKEAEASAGVHVKFWVLGSAEANTKGSVASERAQTQQITLTLKPRLEQTVIDQQGRQMTITRGVDVEGSFAEGEEQPFVGPPAGS